MGREAKILLGMLGMLTGVFVGVLSLKLLVPRPPSGAGPDVHADVTTAPDHELVEPPQLAVDAGRQVIPPVPQDIEGRTSRFSRTTIPAAPRPVQESPLEEPGARNPAPMAQAPNPIIGNPNPIVRAPTSDRFVAAAAYETAAAAQAIDGSTAAAATGPPPTIPDPLAGGDSPAPHWNPTPDAGGDYVTRPGDCWWTVAERAYGDGRFYRALFAWNRAFNPRISLAPGTTLQLPPADRLRGAWPALMPRD